MITQDGCISHSSNQHDVSLSVELPNLVDNVIQSSQRLEFFFCISLNLKRKVIRCVIYMRPLFTVVVIVVAIVVP